ncbi:unnamed protein product, partial [Polarella glacialis]
MSAPGPLEFFSPCWGAGFTYETCCDLRLGPRGNSSCWDQQADFEACCLRGAEVGPVHNDLLNCGGKSCRWASPQACWNQTQPAYLASETRAFSERCVELCCGGLSGILSRAALRAISQAKSHHKVSPRSRQEFRTMHPDKVKKLETTRRCHLHTVSALFCEYENLCMARAETSWAVVFLRSSGHGMDAWTPLQILSSELAFNEGRILSVLTEPAAFSSIVAGGALSVVLPSGFWWPTLAAEGRRPVEQAIVGWSQHASDLLAPSRLRHTDRSAPANVEWLGYAADNPDDTSGNRQKTGVEDDARYQFPLQAETEETALVLGLDPAVAPQNIFHFAQLVLPVWAARVRQTWRGGSGAGSGLLGAPPGFSLVVLADPTNSSHLPWQRGLLQLIAGSPRFLQILDASAQLRGPGPAVRCFRHAILPGNGMKDRAVPSTGRADHAALLVQAARLIPGLRVGPGGSAGGRNIAVVLRSGGSPEVGGSFENSRMAPGRSRRLLNQPEFLAGMRGTIRALTGREPCTAGGGGGAPCIREHTHLVTDFAQQVRLFSGCSLLVGVNGAGLTNMLFMSPESVVLILQPKPIRDYYMSMAYGCGFLGIPFFVDCVVDPRARQMGGMQAAGSADPPFVRASA